MYDYESINLIDPYGVTSKARLKKNMANYNNNFEITEKVLKQVESLASSGNSECNIALALGISYSTLKRRKKDHELFGLAIKRGKSKGIAIATSKLMELVQEKSLGAICYYLNNRDPANWSNKVEHVGDVVKPVQVIVSRADKPKIQAVKSKAKTAKPKAKIAKPKAKAKTK